MFKKTAHDGQKDQRDAEAMGLADKPEEADPAKPAPAKQDAVGPADPGLTCVVKGCSEPKAPGQTFVCVKHIRT